MRLKNQFTAPKSTGQGLAFLALLFFLIGFFIARIFTTIYPDTVVVSSGIHFHHFWYGLGMIIVAGWLGIASNRPEYDRVYAVFFGLGLGLVGDETGLLLTLGDYHSELTYAVVLIGFSCAVMLILAKRYWSQVRTEVNASNFSASIILRRLVAPFARLESSPTTGRMNALEST